MKRFGSKFYKKNCKDLDLTPFKIPQKIVHKQISDSKYKTFMHKKFSHYRKIFASIKNRSQ